MMLPAFFCSGEARFYHCKAALHKEYQCRTDQEPDTVNVIVYQVKN